MNNLTELYAKRQVFLDYGVPIPESLASEIKDAEGSIFVAVINTLANIAPAELNDKVWDTLYDFRSSAVGLCPGRKSAYA